MGTVGLSFGSPTSGAGFNVSSTVAEIVGNLQNVETPWKTQLTTLQSQDTAISSLGTLFSNLSNDMSSLTDLQGILAQKTGSSSDTNVLTLTAADSRRRLPERTRWRWAIWPRPRAGTWRRSPTPTITLAGSITLQAGSGTQLTITLNSSDNTLAGLAATINASAVGINASVLTDSSGSMLSLVSGTSGALRKHQRNLEYDCRHRHHGLELHRHGGQRHAGIERYADGACQFERYAHPAPSLSRWAAARRIPSWWAPRRALPRLNTFYTGSASGWNTLTGLEDAINTASIGVTASIVTNGSGAQSLSLVSNTTGTAGTLAVTSSINDITGTTSLGYTSPVSGADANLTVDGVALTSASNTVANLIPGVTFQLLAPSATNAAGAGGDRQRQQRCGEHGEPDGQRLQRADQRRERPGGERQFGQRPSRSSALPRFRCCSSSC